MDLNTGSDSPGDQMNSNPPGNREASNSVRNIHGETVGRRTKKYLVGADESSTDGVDDYENIKDGVQNGGLFVNSDRVSSIDVSPSTVHKSTNSKMSDKSAGVKKNSTYERLLLSDGKELKGESVSDYEKLHSFLPNGRASEKRQSETNSRKVSDASESAPVSDTPEKPLSIPADGNLLAFSIDDMAAFFRAMSVDELIVQRLHRKKLDGKKFSKLKDTVMEEIGIKNPIISYFRDRSKKDRLNFML